MSHKGKPKSLVQTKLQSQDIESHRYLDLDPKPQGNKNKQQGNTNKTAKPKRRAPTQEGKTADNKIELKNPFP